MRLPLLLLPTCALAFLIPEKSDHGYRLEPSNQKTHAKAEKRSKRQIAIPSKTYKFTKWTDDTVYYYFDSSIGPTLKQIVRAAVAYYREHTCINFVESAKAKNRIRIHKGVGCGCDYGMQGGEQNMSLANGCESIGTVAHEFGHALGLIHTQNRRDRDNFLTIDYTYVDELARSDFQTEDSTIYAPFEYGSVMQYPAWADTTVDGEITMIAKDPRYQYTMGSEFVSFYDLLAINKHYECTGCAKCMNGGVPNVRNCKVCECPAGYGGALCNQRPNTCGQSLVASSSWKTQVLQVGLPNENKIRNEFEKCNTWITAPEGKRIEVKLVDMFNPNCKYGCIFNGIEIKGEEDQRITNPRYCCPDQKGTIVKSLLNPTPIITYARVWYAKFTIEYRYVEGPPTTTTTTTTPAPIPTCRDRSKCDKEYCSSYLPFYEKKFNCGETCGYCDKPAPECKDSPMCKSMLEMGDGTCEGLRDDMDGDGGYVEYYCQKTCGFCSDVATAAPSSASTSCKDNRQWCDAEYCDPKTNSFRDRKYYCGKTCGLCDKAHPTCDDGENCAEWLKDAGGSCEQLLKDLEDNKGLLENICTKSCGFCSSPNATTTSTKAPVTTPSTTTMKPTDVKPSEALPDWCKDSKDFCNQEYCDSTFTDFRTKKFSCGRTCGLCFKTADPCVDSPDCQETLEWSGGSCEAYLKDTDNDRMVVEYYCAKTCGYCSNVTTTSYKTPVNTASTTKKPTEVKPTEELPDWCQDSKDFCNQEYCGSTDTDFRTKKFSCGRTCGLCFKTADPCVDSPDCQETLEWSGGSCEAYLKDTDNNRMIVEYYCAKTCGYCSTNSTVTATKPKTVEKPNGKIIRIVPASECYDRQVCSNRDCTSNNFTYNQKKFYCGVTCGLCGKKPETCVDSPDCADELEASGTCDQLVKDYDGEEAFIEMKCAKSCGYC